MQHDIYRKIIMNISVGFAYHEMIFSDKGEPIDFEFIDVNDFFGEIVGYSSDKIKGKKITEIHQYLNVDDFDWRNAFNDIFTLKEGKTFTIYSLIRNRYYSVNAYAISKKHFITVLNDITDVGGQFQPDDNQIRLIIDAISEGIVCIDTNGICVFCNSQALKILGFTLEETLGKHISEIVRDENGEFRFSPTLTLADIIKETSQKIYWIKNDVYLHFASKNQYNNGERIGTVLTFYDINIVIEMQSQLEDKEKENALLLRNLPGMVYRSSLERDKPLLYVSSGSWDLTGYPPSSFTDTKGVSLDKLIIEDYRSHIHQAWNEAITKRIVFKEEYVILTGDGAYRWVLETARPIINEANGIEGFEGIIVNIDQLKKKQKEIEYLTCHDQLTGLYNRNYFEIIKNDYLQAVYLPLTTMMVDINGLRVINETIGLEEGDKVIQTAARIIESCCNDDDIIARIAGASFIILMPNRSLTQATEVLNKIKSICARHNQSMHSSIYHINLSIGLATQTSIDQHYDDIRKQAEDAMYKNKLLDNSSTHSAVIASITSAMFERSHETELHSYRIKDLAKQISMILGLSPEKTDELLLLATLHDIGKVAISDAILNKPGPLTPEEWVEMRKHPMVGYRIAKASPMLKPIANYILSHHERWDGTGYPRGLKGLEIPLLSRIISVVDAFDAMTEDRPYRSKRTVDEALKEIVDNSGTQFDPRIASIFVKMILDGINSFRKK